MLLRWKLYDKHDVNACRCRLYLTVLEKLVTGMLSVPRAEPLFLEGMNQKGDQCWFLRLHTAFQRQDGSDG